MNVNLLQSDRNSVIFKGKIIDAHAHIGKLNDKVSTKEMLDTFTKSELPNKEKDVVEKMFVSNLDVLTGIKSEYEGNTETVKLFGNNEKYELFASCNPEKGNIENIKKLYQENPNKFLGLKFHPSIQNLATDDVRYDSYMQFADENKLPCLFHSSVNIDNSGKLIKDSIDISDPEKIYKLAQKHKDTPVIMAHMGAGWNESHDKAIDVMVESIKKGDANLYADISWVDIGLAHNGNFPENEHRGKEHIIKAIKTLKGIDNPDWKYGDQSYRLMFGSDAPIDRFSGADAMKEYTTFIDDIKHAIKNDKDLKPQADKTIEDLFYNNAKKLYDKTKHCADTVKDNVSGKTTSKNKNVAKATGIIAGVVASAGALAYAYQSLNNKKSK